MAKKHVLPNAKRFKRIMLDVFGISELRPGQKEIIRSISEGRNTLAIMPTGAGKVPLLSNSWITSSRHSVDCFALDFVTKIRIGLALLKDAGVIGERSLCQVQTHKNKSRSQ